MGVAGTVGRRSEPAQPSVPVVAVACWSQGGRGEALQWTVRRLLPSATVHSTDKIAPFSAIRWSVTGPANIIGVIAGTRNNQLLGGSAQMCEAVAEGGDMLVMQVSDFAEKV